MGSSLTLRKIEAPMSKSLKQRNQPQIVTFLVMNACLLLALTFGPSHVLGFLNEATKGDLALLGKLVAAPAVLSLLVGILGWSVPRSWKEVLVFWRASASRLPSSRAFSHLAPSDTRINLDRLRSRIGTFPKNPARQTALWYRMYLAHRAVPSVDDANAAYLRYRDMSAILPFLVVASLTLAIFRGTPWTKSVLSESIFFAEYLIVSQAATNAAKSLVTNVLAFESSREVAENSGSGQQ